MIDNWTSERQAESSDETEYIGRVRIFVGFEVKRDDGI